jgi:hypothetical protein
MTTLAHGAPTEAEFRAALVAMARGDWAASAAHAADAGYQLAGVVQENTWYAVLQEKGSGGVGPTVVISPHPLRDLIAEAPHGGLERGTAEQAALFVTRLGARAAIVSGAHRCASATESPCSGRTRVCGSEARVPYRSSDVAHYPNSLFHVAHLVLTSFWPSAVVVSLHGMRKTDDTILIVSDGSKQMRPGDHELSGRLRDRLRTELGGNFGAVVSCNDPEDDQYDFRKLCGFTNVQGRALNSSPDICLQSSQGSSGRFLHVEQSWDILGEIRRGWTRHRDYPHAGAFFAAFEQTIPCLSDDCGQ